MSFERLQKKLNYQFKDLALLELALTHKSYGHEFFQEKAPTERDNEQLEFLGDAIVEFIVTDLLLKTFKGMSEGDLSRLRSSLVSEKAFASLAEAIELQDWIRLGKGEAQSGGNKKASILASTFEALIAGIYQDGGFFATCQVVQDLFAPLIKDEKFLNKSFNPKTMLQEKTQSIYQSIPTYHLIQTQGLDHAKVFEIEVQIEGCGVARARGGSKKEAEQKAASLALKEF